MVNKTRRKGNIIRRIKLGGKIDMGNSYVWFKNNCPLDGPLYDDFRIADMFSYFTIIIVQIHSNENMVIFKVFEKTNDLKHISFEFDSVVKLVEWINESKLVTIK